MVLGEGEQVGVGDTNHELDSCVGEGLEDLNVGVIDSHIFDRMEVDKLCNFVGCWKVICVSTIADTNDASTTKLGEEREEEEQQRNQS